MKESKYAPIYRHIVQDIQRGIYKTNAILPSENELSQKFGTSRETIRKALNLLAQNGYIQKIKGKGSVVLDIKKMSFPVSGLVSFKELQQSLGRDTETIVYDFGLIHPGEFLQQQLQVKPNAEVWKVIRARKIQGERIILDRDFLLKEYVPLLTKEICEQSIYQYLEQELELHISFAKKEIVVEPCTDEDRSYLDIEGFDHIVVVKNYVYLEDASLFQYTESRHRLDKFRFVDFARRTHR
ncbi:MAG TPA: trehalose operon repressor [Bacillus sp. (in: firmicutes)]|uniref:trehalose operon repressor n=1 Tax=Bacillus litorisediminis TaxID=2922713 RepID=UPI001FAE2B6D|nr:trehalose operon repressor [Bacillus litorisediminis]HWO74568.1 trehalose operon repressor [Bacillus sp. (in: firmicutes)]